jgi:citrate lyase subunit beta/citryl-CoA lyase
MVHPVRPRRSALFMPGSNARALDKARTLPADVVILDLEDAVAPGAKVDAREGAAGAVRAGGYGNREVVVRVNGLDTPWGRDDLVAVARAGPHAVLVPKVESAQAVREVGQALEAARGSSAIALWCMLETPRGILEARAIAAATPRVGALVMGTSDLTKDLHARHTRDRLPVLTSLGLSILAARAAGVVALDGVHLDLDDDAGLVEACRQAREMGFDGKTLIHPKQIDAANRAFGPTEAEIAWARRVVAAHAQAERGGRGVVLLDGRLVENLHVEDARRVVAAHARAEAEGRGVVLLDGRLVENLHVEDARRVIALADAIADLRS